MDEKEKIRNHFDNIAREYDYWKSKNSYYYSLISNFYRKHIPVNSSVVEFGCGTGDILANCKPKNGLGLDISENIIALARNKYPQYEFKTADVENFYSEEKFDYVIMSDVIDHLFDIPKAIESSHRLLNNNGKIIISTINPLWNPAFDLLEKLKMKMPEGPHCFIPNRFLEFFCQAKGFNIVSKGALVLIPKRMPLISDLINNIAVHIPILNRFCWVQTLIAQKIQLSTNKISYSVIIPAYNEENNIKECIARIPKTDRDYEIIVVDDGSNDSTPMILEKLQKEVNNLKNIVFPQNKGKSSAVEEAIRCSTKEALVILDADMAVAPEDIPLFIEPLEKGIVDFVNGTRLIYGMEKNAMNQIKRIGNFFFALLFSAILRMRLTDILCGTKAFFAKDFKDVSLSGERWGDFALIWAARKKGLRVGEIPVRYHIRKSGLSKMRPFLDGVRFLRYISKIILKEILGL